MKKLIWYLILIVLLFSLSFEAKSFSSDDKTKNIKVVTSFYPMYIMAKNVTNNIPSITVQNLTPPTTGCLHDYSITTDDMKKLTEAQILVINGAGMESFLNKVTAQYPKIKIVKLSEGIPLIKGNEGENPHVWVSVSDAISQVKTLEKALGKYDPKNKKGYQKNAAKYIAKLETLKRKMHKELAPYKEAAIITFHEAFPYFAREFGLKIAAVVEREPGNEPSAKELADTIKLIKKHKIKALFSEPQYPAKSANIIARETGLKVYILDPAVTGSDDNNTYINIMEKNLATFKEAFK